MDDGRRNLLISAAFGGVVVVAILILVGAIAIGWYTDNFGELARVNGVSIDRSEFRDRYRVELFRLDYAMRRLRDDLAAGRISQADHDSQAQVLQQRRDEATLQQLVLARLIDQELESQLAVEEGISVTEADVDARIHDDATRPEQRHAWLIAVDPEVVAGGTPTEEDRTAAREKLEQALADVAAGTTWQEVAAEVSTDSSALQNGDLGYVSASDASLDPAFHDALFAATADAPTGIVEGADGILRAGLVTDIAPAFTDPAFEQQLADAEIPLAAYRVAARSDVLRGRLEEKIVAGVVDAPSPQRRVAEIFLAEAADRVRVRHILFSPNDDPEGAANALDPDDPAWATAEAEARALHDELAALADGDDKLLAAFTEAAKDSDEDGAAESGGLLPFLSEEELDPEFGAAVFADGLENNDLLEPVRSAFGWHVVLFDERQPPAQQRIETLRQRALSPGVSFAAIAQAESEGSEAADGGDLGWIARSQMPAELETPIFDTPVGGVSNVITIPGEGFYLLKVLEEETRLPDGEQLDTLRSIAYRNWYAARRATAEISTGSSVLTPIG
jgi:parvulin-like peptidyl-prolyl isomerase